MQDVCRRLGSLLRCGPSRPPSRHGAFDNEAQLMSEHCYCPCLQIASIRTEGAQEREQLAASASALAAQLDAAQQEAAGARAGLEAQLAAATLERQRLQERSNELEEEVSRAAWAACCGWRRPPLQGQGG